MALQSSVILNGMYSASASAAMTDEADGPNTGAASSPVSASAMISSAGAAPGATPTIPTPSMAWPHLAMDPHGVASSGDGSGQAQQGKCKPLKRPRGKRGGNRGHTKRRARNSEHNNTIRNQMRAKLNGKVAMCTQRAGRCPREALASWDSSGNIGWCRQCWVEFYGKSKVYDTAQEQQKDAAPSGVVEDR